MFVLLAKKKCKYNYANLIRWKENRAEKILTVVDLIIIKPPLNSIKYTRLILKDKKEKQNHT